MGFKMTKSPILRIRTTTNDFVPIMSIKGDPGSAVVDYVPSNIMKITQSDSFILYDSDVDILCKFGKNGVYKVGENMYWIEGTMKCVNDVPTNTQAVLANLVSSVNLQKNTIINAFVFIFGNPDKIKFQVNGYVGMDNKIYVQSSNQISTGDIVHFTSNPITLI